MFGFRFGRLSGGTVNVMNINRYYDLAKSSSLIFYTKLEELTPNSTVISQTSEGTPEFNQPCLTSINSGKSVKLKTGDKLKYGLNSYYSRTTAWAVEFVVNYTTIGVIIDQMLSGVGWSIEIDTDGRLKASAIANYAGDDYVYNKSTEVLSSGTSYHCLVIFQFNLTTPVAYYDIPKVNIFINGREQVPYPGTGLKDRRSLAATINATNILTIGSDTFSGYVDEVAVYSDMGNYVNTQKRAWLAKEGTLATVPNWVKPVSKVNLILDHDTDCDPDDSLDHHTAIALDRLGLVNLVGHIISVKTDYGAGAAKAISDWWDDRTPLGAYQGTLGRGYTDAVPGFNGGMKGIRDNFRPGDVRQNYPSGVEIYRMVLSQCEDNSVVIVSTGYLLSIWLLMLSEADAISPLTGLELINSKVNTIFVVGNLYPYNAVAGIEYDASSHPTSWKYVIENFQNKIIFSGGELALPVQKGAPIKVPDDYATNPYRQVYHTDGFNARPIWGVLPLLVAARGLNGIALSYPFTQTVNVSNGQTSEPAYALGANRWFLRFSDQADKAMVGNELTEYIDYIASLDNTQLPNLKEKTVPTIHAVWLQDQTTSTIEVDSLVSDGGHSTTVTVEYGLTASYGSSLVIGVMATGTRKPIGNVTGLTPGQTYHWRIKAENTLGVVYSGDNSVTLANPEAILQDGYTVTRSIFDSAHCTVDGSNRIAEVSNAYGTNAKFAQTTDSLKPILSSEGATFDGTDDYLIASLGLVNLPITVYMVVKNVTNQTYQTMLCGSNENTFRVLNHDAANTISIRHGVAYVANTNYVAGSWNVVTAVFDGANSRIRIGKGTAVTGNPGATSTNTGGTIKLGGHASFANVAVKDVIIRNKADDTTTELNIINLLYDAYGL